MNKKQQQKHIGQTRRLRPLAKDSDRGEVDDHWLVESADADELKLVNQKTKDRLVLGYDHILEYRTPDFLILKSQVALAQGLVTVEPIYQAPRVVLNVGLPLPPAAKDESGFWVQVVDVMPSQDSPVPNATVEVEFDSPYASASYEVVRKYPSQALIFQELFGAIGTGHSTRFAMGLAELPRNTWIRLRFFGNAPPQPTRITLNPYFKA